MPTKLERQVKELKAELADIKSAMNQMFSHRDQPWEVSRTWDTFARAWFPEKPVEPPAVDRSALRSSVYREEDLRVLQQFLNKT